LCTVLGVFFGTIIGFACGYLLGNINLYGIIGPFVGLIGGIALGVYLYHALYELSDKILKNRRSIVAYQPVRCAWCKGTGKKFFLLIFKFKCSACGGRGSVLAAEKSRKCGWCNGTGKRFMRRCPVCDGTGWAHSSIDDT
jgi:RecJ-like exonuclease